MQPNKIIKELDELNPWWQAGFSIEEEQYSCRSEFSQLVKLIPLKLIISLAGLRRVGKTTLLKQLIINLIKKSQIKPANICYFLFDDLEQSKPGAIRQVLDTYLNNKLHTTLARLKSKVYIILDEVHFVDGWQIELKKFYDTSSQVKFIISGSSSLFVQKKAHQSLAGRILEQYIPPLSFQDFLKINQAQVAPSFQPIKLNQLNTQVVKDLSFDVLANLQLLDSLYQKYIVQGQFPEIVNFKDNSLIRQYLKSSIIQKVIEHDVPKIFDIDKLSELKNIFQIAIKETGNLIEYQNIAAETGISKITVAKYIDILKQTFLIKEIFNYQKSARVAPHALKKVYSATTNFTCALFDLSGQTLGLQGIMGHLVETQVLAQLETYAGKIVFWHQRGAEVDFLISLDSGKLPIEVKYKNNIYHKDFKNLIKLMDKMNLSLGIMLTRNRLEVKKINHKEILLLPVWII